jgi:hypothetical protein
MINLFLSRFRKGGAQVLASSQDIPQCLIANSTISAIFSLRCPERIRNNVNLRSKNRLADLFVVVCLIWKIAESSALVLCNTEFIPRFSEKLIAEMKGV